MHGESCTSRYARPICRAYTEDTRILGDGWGRPSDVDVVPRGSAAARRRPPPAAETDNAAEAEADLLCEAIGAGDRRQGVTTDYWYYSTCTMYYVLSTRYVLCERVKGHRRRSSLPPHPPSKWRGSHDIEAGPIALRSRKLKPTFTITETIPRPRNSLLG